MLSITLLTFNMFKADLLPLPQTFLIVLLFFVRGKFIFTIAYTKNWEVILNFYLSFSIRCYTDLEELTLVRILALPWLLPVFPGSHPQTSELMRFKVESIASVSTRIWQDFPFLLILVSTSCFRE